jgi:hypothetical protein
MVTRRKLVLSGTAAVLAATLPPPAFAADDPAGILTAIYTRVAKGKGDSGGTFVFENKHYFGRIWRLIVDTGFPNRVFNDSWVVGFWRAGHGEHYVEVGR